MWSPRRRSPSLLPMGLALPNGGGEGVSRDGGCDERLMREQI